MTFIAIYGRTYNVQPHRITVPHSTRWQDIKINTNLPRQHPFQKRIGFLLLFDQLPGSLHNQLLQVVRVLFHHVHYVVKDVCFPVERTTKKEHLNDATRNQGCSPSSPVRDCYSGHVL